MTELLDAAIAALDALASSESWPTELEPFPRPYSVHPALEESLGKFDLPMVLVPPEAIELEGSTENSSQSKKDEWPEWALRLFPDDVTPNPNTPSGNMIRSTIYDIIDIFEVNRKECARILLEYPKWTSPGTFRPKPGAPTPEGTEDKPKQ